MKRVRACALCVAWLVVPAIYSTVAAKDAVVPREPDGGDVKTTHHAVTLKDGRRLGYIARAGFLVLVNDATGETTAHVYFVSYTADQKPNDPERPITFIFPGGPGGAASLSKSSPRRVEVKDDKASIVENPDTLL